MAFPHIQRYFYLRDAAGGGGATQTQQEFYDEFGFEPAGVNAYYGFVPANVDRVKQGGPALSPEPGKHQALFNDVMARLLDPSLGLSEKGVMLGIEPTAGADPDTSFRYVLDNLSVMDRLASELDAYQKRAREAGKTLFISVRYASEMNSGGGPYGRPTGAAAVRRQVTGYKETLHAVRERFRLYAPEVRFTFSPALRADRTLAEIKEYWPGSDGGSSGAGGGLPVDILGGTWYIRGPGQQAAAEKLLRDYVAHFRGYGLPFALDEVGGGKGDDATVLLKDNDTYLKTMLHKVDALGVPTEYVTLFLNRTVRGSGRIWGGDVTLAFLRDEPQEAHYAAVEHAHEDEDTHEHEERAEEHGDGDEAGGDDDAAAAATWLHAPEPAVERLAATSPSTTPTTTPATLQLLLDFEAGGGEAYYNRLLKSPVWPGAESGVTIGIGYDLGYVTRAQFDADWGPYLSAAQRRTLHPCLGLKRQAARNALTSAVRALQIPWTAAYRVFQDVTLPRFWAATRTAFPGVESLPGDSAGALLSLVYNRGASMANTDRRREMRQIRAALAAGRPAAVPALIRSMTRIWAGTDIAEGMRRRREAEARLFEAGLASAAGPPERGAAYVTPPVAPLSRVLQRGSVGEDVRTLQTALEAQGYELGAIDGEYGPRTETAVRAFQRRANLTADGVTGPLTWRALFGTTTEQMNRTRDNQEERRRHLADFAQHEAAKQLRWTSPADEAEKYLAPLRAPMRRLGHIGREPVFYNWCAAFVTYCCREVGFTIPDQPEGLRATMALVQAWQFWARRNGTWHPKGTIAPKPGDIVCFEWFDEDSQLDHIGIVRDYTAGSASIETSEGNAGNVTANRKRDMANVVGFIRLV